MTTKKPASKHIVSKRTLGIDIGVECLRVVCLSEEKAQPGFEWCASLPLPEDAVKDGVVLKPRQVARAIRKLLRASNGPSIPATLAVPADQTLVRLINLPILDDDALAAAAPFEARKYLPYPSEEAEIQMWPLSSPGSAESGRMRAVLVAAPRNVVSSRAESLEMAGIHIAGIEIEPFALVRSLDRPGRWRGGFWSGQSQGYLHLASRSTGLYVMQDASPRFVRSVPWGAARLVQAVADTASCSLDAAQAILNNPTSMIDESGGFVREGQFIESLSAAVAAELLRLVREIERLLSYYRSQYPERSYEGALTTLTLCDDLASLKGLDGYFARRLQIDVSVENPFDNLKSTAEGALAAFSPGQLSTYAVACGLALGQLDQRNRVGQTGDDARANERSEFVWRCQAA